MTISFQCSSCQASLNVSEEYAGKNANCPQCGAAFVVPQPTAAPSPAPAPAPGGFGGMNVGEGQGTAAPLPNLPAQPLSSASAPPAGLAPQGFGAPSGPVGGGAESGGKSVRKRRGGKWLTTGIQWYPILGIITASLGGFAFLYYGYNAMRILWAAGFDFDRVLNTVMFLGAIALATVITALSCFVAGDYLKSYLSDR